MTADLLTLAVEAAHGAGELLSRSFAGPLEGVATKSSPTDLVSQADRDAEQFLVDFIASKRPDDGILAEEGGRSKSATGLRWVIDPLDGTVNFLFRIPVWAVSIAVEDPTSALVGVVHDPNRDETFTAQRGRGARVNDRPIQVSDRTDLATALIGTGFAYEVSRRAAQARVAAAVLTRVRDIRRAGSAALDLCSVACGRLDGFYEAYTEPWDRAAGALIVTEAGGTVSEEPAPADEGTTLVAGNATLHRELRKLLRGAPQGQGVR
ncbi:MAG: inositol monophosphatase family protein [Actinomycetota bacterium]